MATDLADHVEQLKREVAVPGAFAELFPQTTDDDLIATLTDAVAEAQLDGFLLAHTVAVDDGIVDPSLSLPATALVVIYAGLRIVRNEIRNRPTHFRAEAAGNVYERDQGSQMLQELMRDLAGRRADLRRLATRPATVVYSRDGYAIRAGDVIEAPVGLAALTR